MGEAEGAGGQAHDLDRDMEGTLPHIHSEDQVNTCVDLGSSASYICSKVCLEVCRW